MRIIKRSTLRAFWQANPAAEQALKAWFQEARTADWKTPHEVKARYAHASIIADNRVVFNIAGNRYRLVVKFNYDYGLAYIRFVGTHAEYDSINAGII